MREYAAMYPASTRISMALPSFGGLDASASLLVDDVPHLGAVLAALTTCHLDVGERSGKRVSV